MMRVIRGAEPETLGDARNRRLPVAAQVMAAGGPLAPALTGYNVEHVKERLYQQQHKKCVYCDLRTAFSSAPIEHFRPKDGAWRHVRGDARRHSPSHYWWLTWSWENLWFACARCNDQGHKGNYFPLEPGSPEASPPALPLASPIPQSTFDVSAERPLLLDPARDIFLDHIVWKPSDMVLPRKLWRWSPHPLTERGDATIKTLVLGELADEVQHHAAKVVLPGVEEVEGHLKGRRTHKARARWTALLDLVRPDEALAAVTWCVLEEWVPDGIRSLNGLPAPVRPA